MNPQLRLSLLELSGLCLLILVTTAIAQEIVPEGESDNQKVIRLQSSSDQCTEPSFDAATNFAVGDGPISVAIGDFNVDGGLDLAVANLASGSVSILLGDGKGGFAAATNFRVGEVGDASSSVAVGDFNVDGSLDLAVANLASGSVSILLGDGKGSFAAATNFKAGNGPGLISVAVGDFNVDGMPDLAVANELSDITILLGDGKGSFAAATNFAVGKFPLSVAVGDFNVDGKPDLAIANGGSDNVSILLGDGKGSFAAATNFRVGDDPSSVAVGDFNADGSLDLAAANTDSDNVSILLGDGKGSFAAATNFGVGDRPRSVAIGDFNEDGSSDLAVANFNSGNVSILLGDGKGSFAAATNFNLGGKPRSVAIGDFNKDGSLDLAVANFDFDNILIMRNTCPATQIKDFSLSFSSSTLNVKRGQKGIVAININRTGGFTGNVTVTAPDTRAFKIKLSPTMQSTTGTNLSFDFKIKKSVPIGTRQLIFTGQDDAGRVRTATLTLAVQ